MGGRSNSNSSSSTTSNIDNSNVFASGNGIILQTEGTVNSTTLMNTDHEAVESAFEFGHNALTFGLDVLQETNELGKFALNEAQ